MNKLFAILDSARMLNKIRLAKKLNSQFFSLYKGRSEQSLEMVAPYLFILDGEPKFLNWLAKKGWGNSWGVYIYSNNIVEEIYSHFRKFLLVRTETGEELYFRFYDPRVLRLFLPTCEPEQLKEFFGPVNYFVVEGEDPKQALIFSLKEDVLHTEVKPVEKLRLMNP